MGYVGIEEDYYISVKSVLDITAETGALTTQSRIRELTPADVAPVVHGRWKKQYRYQVNSICSVCGNEVGRCTRYCPNCGAKMDAQGEE